jgi:hypothetical protein
VREILVTLGRSKSRSGSDAASRLWKYVSHLDRPAPLCIACQRFGCQLVASLVCSRCFVFASLLFRHLSAAARNVLFASTFDSEHLFLLTLVSPSFSHSHVLNFIFENKLRASGNCEQGILSWVMDIELPEHGLKFRFLLARCVMFKP